MKNKKLYGLLGVAALAAVGGTFAYYNAQDTFINQFDTISYGTSTTEQFNPGDGRDWKPGAEVEKSVTATNTGKGDVWVRVKFDEEWSGLKTGEGTDTLSLSSADKAKFFPGGFQADLSSLSEEEKAEAVADGNAAAGANQADAADGKVQADKAKGSVVYKLTDNVVEDFSAGQHWYYNADDGYFYYCKPLVSKESTVELLKEVKLAGATDIGSLAVSNGYFTIAEAGLDAMPEPEFEFVDGIPQPKAGQANTWYALAEDKAVPTKKVVSTDGISKIYIVAMTDAQMAQALADNADKEADIKAGNFDDVEVSADCLKELAKDQTVYTNEAKVLDPNAQGYGNANYNLDITVDYVQADEEAAKAYVPAAGGARWGFDPVKGEAITY